MYIVKFKDKQLAEVISSEEVRKDWPATLRKFLEASVVFEKNNEIIEIPNKTNKVEDVIEPPKRVVCKCFY